MSVPRLIINLFRIQLKLTFPSYLKSMPSFVVKLLFVSIQFFLKLPLTNVFVTLASTDYVYVFEVDASVTNTCVLVVYTFPKLMPLSSIYILTASIHCVCFRNWSLCYRQALIMYVHLFPQLMFLLVHITAYWLCMFMRFRNSCLFCYIHRHINTLILIVCLYISKIDVLLHV